MREELVGLEEPGMWNEFLRGLRAKVLEGELGGDRREFWWEVRRKGLGLVTKNEMGLSDVEEDEAKEVSSRFEV